MLFSFVIQTGCLESEFQCKNQCIPNILRCDTHLDCEHGEDEKDCSKNSESERLPWIFIFFLCPWQWLGTVPRPTSSATTDSASPQTPCAITWMIVRIHRMNWIVVSQVVAVFLYWERRDILSFPAGVLSITNDEGPFYLELYLINDSI